MGVVGTKRQRTLVFAISALLIAAVTSSVAHADRRPPLQADRILVLKSHRVLVLLRHGVVERVYPIALGPEPVGPKHAQGDGRTPEGDYVVDSRNLHSAYHLALHISYPNAEDLAHASAQHVDPGGDIFIHGLPDWYGGIDPVRFDKDWTKGCISVGNRAIAEIAAAVPDGTPIEIRP